MGEVVFHEEVDSQHLDYSALVLSAICGADTFAYLVSDTGEKHLASRSLHFDKRYHHFDKPLGYLSEVMLAEEILYEDFREARFAMRRTPFLLSNTPTLRNADAKTLLRQVTHLAPEDVVIIDEIQSTDVRIIHAVPDKFRGELTLYFESAQICHVISALIWSALKRSRRDRHLMLLVVNRGWLEIITVLDHTLQFANHFPWQAPDDILYYATAVLRELDVEITALDIAVLGGAHNPELEQYLRTHLQPPGDTTGQNVRPVELRLYDLLSVARCGL